MKTTKKIKIMITKGKFNDGHEGWKISDVTTNGTLGFEIHYSDDGECITDHVYKIEDALLIAKAPNMLKVLKNIMNCYEKKGQLLSFNINEVREVLLNL